MTTFADLPKQWLIARNITDAAQGVPHASFQGWHIQTAPHVPVLSLQSADGTDLGRVIGWTIFDGRFYREDTTVTLPAEDTADTLYTRMTGRFVMLWQDAEGKVLLREDGSGLLPAIYAPGLEAVGATITALEMLGPLTPDPEVIAIFDFPKRMGVLPLGLTPRSDAHRLMPNHTLDLSAFTAKRSWPDAEYCIRKPMSEAECRDRAARCATIVQEFLQALTAAQGDTVLYLSAGHDSRAISAAALAGGVDDKMIYHTTSAKGGVDCFVATKLTRKLDRPHKIIEIGTTPMEEQLDWIKRTGDMIYDVVTVGSNTMLQHAPDNHPLSGSGADIMRGANWAKGDDTRAKIDTTQLLKQMRMIDVPPIRRVAEAWMAGIPETADAAMILDLIKTEQIQGCWSGSAIYGLPLPLPTLHPFAGHALNSLVLDMPTTYRATNGMYDDYMAQTAPWLGEIPVNRPEGLHRLRFLKHEIRRMIPKKVKRLIRPHSVS